uniref:20 kDa chaperonin, chloroplastic n=1 Tax=Leersia perrieri TaxID=77586 RepID=A0A0D9XE40_9ORYZ
MPAANSKLAAKPSPPATATSVPRPKATAKPFSRVLGYCDGSDDDDDFQSPPHARALKPSNGAGAGAASRRPSKKLKPLSSSCCSGKENRAASGGRAPAGRAASKGARVGETLAVVSGVSSGVQVGDKAVGSGICGRLRCGSDNSSSISNGKKGLDRYGYCNGGLHSLPNSMDSSVSMLDATSDLENGCSQVAQMSGSRDCISVPLEGNDAMDLGRPESDPMTMQKECTGSEVHEGDYPAKISEPRLLELDGNCDFGGADSKDSKEHGPGIHDSNSNDRNVEEESGVASVYRFALDNKDCHLSCVEWEHDVSNGKYDFDGHDCKGNEQGLGLDSLISEKRAVAAESDATFSSVGGENTSSGLEAFEGSHCSGPVEPKLMESCATHGFQGDGYDDFEIGTQLNELINLCVEDYAEGPLSNKASCIEVNGIDSRNSNSVCQVQCPLCGSNLSDLTEELRMVHTNSCLDGDEPAKEPNSNHQNEPSAENNVENRPVVEWLRNLGLSKYEDIFIKEEVDWETLQWLTEEDLLGMGITSLGPRKKIAHALSELRKKNDDTNDLAADVLNLENTKKDAFRFLRGDCCHWFLTHFHVDHYQGLTKSFCHGKIYCSSVTASLVHYKIGIPWDRLHVLPLNEKITIAGVSLTCFDANHCPGAVIILFEPPNGKAVLHTGDFRFSSEMANNCVLRSSPIHTLILDTTYCNPRKKIYVGAAKLQILKHLELPQEIMHWFTANEAESHIHVVPMWTLASFKRMKYLSTQYAGRFDLIVAFCPTGWSFGKGRKRTPGRKWQQGAIIRYEVPYSEHSSFTELREFVRFISPEHIIPSFPRAPIPNPPFSFEVSLPGSELMASVQLSGGARVSPAAAKLEGLRLAPPSVVAASRGCRGCRGLVVRAGTVVSPKYTSIKPLGDRVLVKIKTSDDKTVGGILLPTSVQSKPQGGEVVAVGEGRSIGSNSIEISVPVGAQVVYSKYAGTELEFNDSDHLILKEDDIIGILDTDDVKDLKPLNDRILIKVAEAEEKTAGGLLLTQATKEKPSIGTNLLLWISSKKVTAVGPGPLIEDGSRKPLSITPGNTVMYSKYAGSEFKGEDGEYIVLRVSDVMAVLS